MSQAVLTFLDSSVSFQCDENRRKYQVLIYKQTVSFWMNHVIGKVYAVVHDESMSKMNKASSHFVSNRRVGTIHYP